MRLQLLSLEMNTGPYQNFVDEICLLAQIPLSSYVCVANAHMVVEAHRSPAFAQVVNNANLVTPDGMPLCKSIHLLYGQKQDRVAGMDLLPDLLVKAEQKHLSVFFYGGSRQMMEQTAAYISKHYPALKLAGLYSPPYRELTPDEEDAAVNMINNSGASLVFVALGCPKQEKWMAAMQGRVQSCMVGIGGALPVMLGLQKRAPKWMQRASLEWLYRLSQEPRRLFKRYAITNNIFLWMLLKQWMNQGFAVSKAKLLTKEPRPGKYVRVSFTDSDDITTRTNGHGATKRGK